MKHFVEYGVTSHHHRSWDQSCHPMISWQLFRGADSRWQCVMMSGLLNDKLNSCFWFSCRPLRLGPWYCARWWCDTLFVTELTYRTGNVLSFNYEREFVFFVHCIIFMYIVCRWCLVVYFMLIFASWNYIKLCYVIMIREKDTKYVQRLLSYSWRVSCQATQINGNDPDSESKGQKN